MKRRGKPWSSQTSATLKVMGGACLISFSAVFVTLAHTEPTVSAFYRMVLGGGILMAVGGLYLIVGLDWDGFSSDYKTGVVLGLLAACCYTGYILFLRMSQASSTTFATITLSTVCTALFLGLFSAGQRESFAVPDLQSWIALAAYALVSQVLGWLFITSGIGRIEASRLGLVLLLQPTLAFVWDVLFFHRPVTPVEAVGAFLALFAIYLGTMGRVTRP